MVLSIELKMLLWSCVLGIVTLLVASQAAVSQNGVKWNMSPRDNDPELKGMAGRLDRAYKNFLQTFPYFIAAILMVQITQMQTSVTSLGAHVYFWARVVYVPLYAAGIPGVRSLVWLISLIGILMVFSALF